MGTDGNSLSVALDRASSLPPAVVVKNGAKIETEYHEAVTTGPASPDRFMRNSGHL
jgi:hypothetical protein